MDRYGGRQTALTIALLGGLYLAIIMNRYGRPQTAVTIFLLGGLYLAIVMASKQGHSKCSMGPSIRVHYAG
jgi:hypothetical protein